jgi:hypothetical protein
MILWLFALLEFTMFATVLFEQFLPWRVLFGAAMIVIGKALIFNDWLLSFIDIFAAFYILLLIFIDGGWFSYVVMSYFFYKFTISL